jgi:hypothetical protein
MLLESIPMYLAPEINSTVFQQRGLLPLVVLLRLRHAGSRRTSECKVGQQATISDKHSKQISPTTSPLSPQTKTNQLKLCAPWVGPKRASVLIN